MQTEVPTAAPPPVVAARPEVEVDVLVVGAGLSGIATAWYLQRNCPSKRYLVVEAREGMGGTWDLFRYPGIRSDSDLFTFGYSFRPWTSRNSIADGDAVRRYIEDTAAEAGIDQHIRFRHRVHKAAWDSARARWRVEIDADGTPLVVTCRFLSMCSGYYDYAEGYAPKWPDMERFEGRIVHPQHWPEDLDWTGRRVLVIGSGATAVTLVPELAATADHVTMLQRSPSYIIERPAHDRIAEQFLRAFGPRVGHAMARWKNVLLGMAFYTVSQRRPSLVRKLLLDAARKAMPGVDVDRHLNPTYDPWDQRLCLDKDGSLFAAVRSGRASIVTDTIERFTPKGVRTGSGHEIEADLVITATGLNMRLMGGVELSIDDEVVDLSTRYLYKGMMLSGVPNFAIAMGYTNASWTLKCELIARYVTRLINRMDARGARMAIPVAGNDLEARPAIELSSGYVQRASEILPKQGPARPWRLYQNYILDSLMLGLGRVDDDAMQLS